MKSLCVYFTHNVALHGYIFNIKIIGPIKALFVTLSKHSEDEYQQEDPYIG